MTALLKEVILTERRVGDGDTEPYHLHYQFFTTNGALIVEWCGLENKDCEKVKDGDNINYYD